MPLEEALPAMILSLSIGLGSKTRLALRWFMDSDTSMDLTLTKSKVCKPC